MRITLAWYSLASLANVRACTKVEVIAHPHAATRNTARHNRAFQKGIARWYLLGIVKAKDMLSRCVSASLDLQADLKQPLFVPESTPAIRALEMFKAARTYLALVIDEYGKRIDKVLVMAKKR